MTREYVTQNWMIGDWYQWYAECRYYPYQVKAEDFTKDYIANFEPIPLTPEILEKNGFKMNFYYYDKLVDDYTSIHWTEQNPLNLKDEAYPRLSIMSKAMDIRFMPCIYVHELQHALRLCGLTELADSLKLD